VSFLFQVYGVAFINTKWQPSLAPGSQFCVAIWEFEGMVGTEEADNDKDNDM
jgi:hypothetical protein